MSEWDDDAKPPYRVRVRKRPSRSGGLSQAWCTCGWPGAVERTADAHAARVEHEDMHRQRGELHERGGA